MSSQLVTEWDWMYITRLLYSWNKSCLRWNIKIFQNEEKEVGVLPTTRWVLMLNVLYGSTHIQLWGLFRPVQIYRPGYRSGRPPSATSHRQPVPDIFRVFRINPSIKFQLFSQGPDYRSIFAREVPILVARRTWHCVSLFSILKNYNFWKYWINATRFQLY